MRQNFILVIVLITHACFAQNTRLTGRIIAKNTGEPLPFASLIFEDYNLGISANSEGRYQISIPDSLLQKNIKISFVGFQPEVLKAKKLAGANISLQAKIENLNAVNLYSLKDKHHKILNPFIGKKSVGLGNFSGGSYPSSLARFYAKPDYFKQKCFLEWIKIYFFSTQEQAYLPAKFRVRILKPGLDGKPGEDILVKNLIVQKKPGATRLKINMLPYKLPIPENGFFVAVEHLFIERNKYEEVKTLEVNDTLIYKDMKFVKYGPIFKGVLEDKDKNFRSYYQNFEGWQKMNNFAIPNNRFHGKTPAPAFKIRLTD